MGFADFFIRGVISLNGSGFSAGVRKAQVEMAGLKRSFGELKNVIASGFIATAAKNVIDYGSVIKDTATKLGISTTALQEFTYAAKLNGGSMEDVAGAFKELSKSRAEALANPGGKEANVFAQLGIDAKTLKGAKLEDLFTRVGEAIRTTNFGADELQIVNDLLGRSAGSLIPAFREGLGGLAQEAHRLGQVLDEDVVAKLDEAGDNIDQTLTRLKVGIGSLLGWLQSKANIAGTFWGTVSGKMSGSFADTTKQGLGDRFNQWKEAIKAGLDAVNKGEATSEVVAPRKRKEFKPLDVSSNEKVQVQVQAQRSSMDRGVGVNEMQAIGAYVGSTERMVTLLQKQVWHLASIDRKTNQGSSIQF